MTRKQLQALISAGVFSTALLNGAAYADDAKTGSGNPQITLSSKELTTSTAPVTHASSPASASGAQSGKQATSKDKSAAQHDCAGDNGCGSK